MVSECAHLLLQLLTHFHLSFFKNYYVLTALTIPFMFYDVYFCILNLICFLFTFPVFLRLSFYSSLMSDFCQLM